MSPLQRIVALSRVLIQGAGAERLLVDGGIVEAEQDPNLEIPGVISVRGDAQLHPAAGNFGARHLIALPGYVKDPG